MLNKALAFNRSCYSGNYWKRNVSTTMRAWVCEEYGKVSLKEVETPKFTNDNQVLVKVKASSVNPIDVRMSQGYARELMTAVRNLETKDIWNKQRLPISFGRDFCGEIVQTTPNSPWKIGQEVMGVVPPAWSGAHAEYVVTNGEYITEKPKTTGYADSAAMIYTTATAWSALTAFAKLPLFNAHGQRILIHGGSGGVGTAAIQLLADWHAEKIVSTASAKNQELLRSLGAIPYDYNDPNIKDKLLKEGPFDIIIDCAQSDLADWSDTLLGVWRNSIHIGLMSPLMFQTDRYGVPLGLATTAGTWICRNLENFTKGRAHVYAFFIPDQAPLNYLAKIIDEGKMKPMIEKVYKFEELDLAYQRVNQQKGGGKAVIDMTL